MCIACSKSACATITPKGCKFINLNCPTKKTKHYTYFFFFNFWLDFSKSFSMISSARRVWLSIFVTLDAYCSKSEQPINHRQHLAGPIAACIANWPRSCSTIWCRTQCEWRSAHNVSANLSAFFSTCWATSNRTGKFKAFRFITQLCLYFALLTKIEKYLINYFICIFNAFFSRHMIYCLFDLTMSMLYGNNNADPIEN